MAITPLAANDLITDAMQELGALAAGEPLLTSTGALTNDAAKGLATYNRMLDSANINRGNIFTERNDLYTLTVGQQAYTIGIDPTGVVTANFSVTRPVRLSRVNVLLANGGFPVYRKVRIRSAAQWGARQYRSVESIPFEIYPDYADPISTWLFYPYPDQAYQIEVWSWQQFAQTGPTIGTGTVTTSGTAVTWVSGTQFTSAQAGGGIVINGVTYLVSAYVDATHLTLAQSAGTQSPAVGYVTGGIATLIAVPPGYYEYWVYALAVRLAAAFGRTLAPQTIELWKDAKAEVMSLNAPSPRQRTDADFSEHGTGLYNWLIGLLDD